MVIFHSYVSLPEGNGDLIGILMVDLMVINHLVMEY